MRSETTSRPEFRKRIANMASAPPKGQIYDAVASDYDIIWNVDAVKMLFPLLDSTLKALGPWEGASVLDMACGTGIGEALSHVYDHVEQRC